MSNNPNQWEWDDEYHEEEKYDEEEWYPSVSNQIPF